MARLSMIALLIALCASALRPEEVEPEEACPEGCRCIRNAMTCTNKGLTALPQHSSRNVRILDLSFNNITSLKGLGQRFPELNVLFFRDNTLSTLELSALAGPDAPPHLMAVDLSRNSIAEILAPKSASTNSNLALLYLGSNRIRYLHPHMFRRLPRLEGLSLHDNPLELAGGLPLLVHSRLRALDLTRINAASLTRSAFAEMPALSEISLEGSGVRNITGAFTDLHLLEALYLQSNQITEITAGSFAEDAYLSDLYLDSNPLHSLNVATLPLRRGGKLRIEQTPLACACAYEEVARWAAEREITFQASCYGSPC